MKKKSIKKRKKICVGIVTAITAILLLSKVNHQIKLWQEQKVLEKYGVGEQVEVYGRKVNVYTLGQETSDHTIVYMHGLGMGDTSVAVRPMLEDFQNDYKVCIIDRYGNGMSEDTNKDQTVENIVKEYRETLKNSKEKAPYILVAHSIAGIYATYWAQKYPNEIEAIIYLDADPAECFVQEGKVTSMTLAMAKAECLASTLGLQRFLVSDSTLLGETQNQVYTEEQNTIRKYLMYQHTYSKATCSEMELYYENAQTVLEGNVKLEIPQLYIVANNIKGKYYEDVYSKTLEDRFNGNEEKVRNMVLRREQIIEEKKAIMEERGNVDIVELSGPHCLYEYAPHQVAVSIAHFLDNEIR